MNGYEKMRNALEYADKELRLATEDDRYGDDLVYLVGCMRTGAEVCRATPAAPARNCDVGTAEEQEDRFRRYCNSRGTFCGDCPLYKNRRGECRFAWAQMPYENNEKKDILPPCSCGGEAATVERGTEPEGFAILCSRCFCKTALHPSLAQAEEEWRTMLSHNTTTKEMKGGAE